MKLNDMLYDLLDLAKEESESNRYAHSEEYDKLYEELDRKTLIIDELEGQIGCPLEVVFKLAAQNELYFQFYNELQHWPSIKVDLRKKVVWYCKQVGGHYACSQPLSNYGKTFWLKKDKSE